MTSTERTRLRKDIFSQGVWKTLHIADIAHKMQVGICVSRLISKSTRTRSDPCTSMSDTATGKIYVRDLLYIDTNLRKVWQWFGCVCHRPDEWPEDSRFGTHLRRYFSMRWCEISKSKPCEDLCWKGVTNPDECGPLRGEDRSSNASLVSWDGFLHADKRK